MNYLYGLLKYNTKNIGDDIQSVAAKQFLPQVDILLEREKLNKVKSKKKIKLIMNGWFMHKPANWPPSKDIEPLFISFHISPSCKEELTSKKSLEYFKKYEPIGCRDYYTRDLLLEKGIKAYFSGCLTMTLKKNNKERSNEILFVKLKEKILKNIPVDIIKKSSILDHYVYPSFLKKIYGRMTKSNLLRGRFGFFYLISEKFNIRPFYFISELSGKIRLAEKRIKEAENIIERYSKAKFVITSKLHCALVCLAFDTPLLFVNDNLDDPRFKGLIEHLNSYTEEDFINKIKEIDFLNPKKNPSNISILKEEMIKKCNDFIERDYE